MQDTPIVVLDRPTPVVTRRLVRSRPVLACLAFLVVTLALIASRLPFLSNTLLGEEGMFAALVLNPTPPSAEVANRLPQQLVAQIDGQRIYSSFEHPIVPYLIMERGVGVLGRAAHALDGSFAFRSAVARGCYLALFTIGVLGLIWLAAAKLTEHTGPAFVNPALVIYVLTTPLLLGASIQPQVDGSVGVMLIGFAAFILVAWQGRSRETAAFLVAGILIGLGRIEWALAFAVAALAVLAAQVMLVARAPRYLPLVFVVGLAAGSALSYLTSPADYLSGVDVMRRISATSNGSLEAARQQRPLMTPALILAAAAVGFGAPRLRKLLTDASGALILGLGGVGVIVGFAASNWSGDGFPRYYAPALVALAYAVVDLARRVDWSSLGRIAAVLLILVGLVSNARFARDRLQQDVSISTYPGMSLASVRAQMAESARMASSEHAIPLEHSSFSIYYPGLSFVSRDLGLDGAKDLLAAKNPADLSRLRVP